MAPGLLQQWRSRRFARDAGRSRNRSNDPCELADAVLSDRNFPAFPNVFLNSFEILTGVLAAIVFAVYSSIGRKLCAILIAILVLGALQWLTIQLIGAFLDAFIPILALGVHTW